MKPILALTDFSVAANNGASYAFQMARSLRTGIELCHAFKVPLEITEGVSLAWTGNDYYSLEFDFNAELSCLAEELEQEYQKNESFYQPPTRCISLPGDVSDVVCSIVANQHIGMVIMGMSGAGEFSRFFIGSNSRDLIDDANFPVLLVPKDAGFVYPRKIAFATSLEPGDIEAIHALARLARAWDAEILIAHCTNEKFEQGLESKQVKNFLTEITAKADYDRIYYRHIKSMDVEHGLEWLINHGQVDILAMVHHGRHGLDRWLKQSHTQQMAKQTTLPLLVLPPNFCGTF